MMFDRYVFKLCLFGMLIVLVVCFFARFAVADEPALWKAGVARVVITPEQPMMAAGYAGRSKPSEGKTHDLHAKALALEDSQGTRLVIVTVDLIGIRRPLRDWLEAEVGRRYQLPPEGVLINASHTHCGPELRAEKYVLYDLPAELAKKCEVYVARLKQQLVSVVGSALDNLAPAKLAYARDKADFAINRRTKGGPVDHEVPVLQVKTPDGKLRAVLFGYACHNTTLSFYKFCGDYAGFAQEYFEKAHPGVTALFMIGCGGDQNPAPRRKLELAQQHAQTLANAVEAALESESRPVRGPLRLALDEVTLEFVEPPAREKLEADLKSKNKYQRGHAKLLLAELDKNGKIRTTYPYLVHVVQFGGDLTMVAMAGEVVIDYVLRFKKELGTTPLWVAGYTNDVFGYLPSLRVLKEGGYEGGSATLYGSLPGPFKPSVEKLVAGKVHELVKKTRTPKSTKPSPKHP